MRLFLFATALAIAVLGCSDGKLNLLIVFWGDSDEPSPKEKIPSEPKSSSNVAKPSSSSEGMPQYSSGEEPPSSSSEEPSLSSSSRGPRSSSAKTDSLGNTYEDYPVLEEGALGVNPGWATRYWDGCKPHCSWLGNIVDVQNPKPWSGICKNCDKNDKEISTYKKHETFTEWWAGYLSVPSAFDDKVNGAYTCWDMTPFVINDTLAYGFAAMNPEIAECGVCYQLEFDGGWYWEPKQPRSTQRALKGKTMIVMASNIGPDVMYNVEMKDGRKGTQFDIMFPGGGVGARDCFSQQLGIGEDVWGEGTVMGGLLNNCLNDGINKVLGLQGDNAIRDGSHRATLEQMQECLRKECKRVFSKNNQLLNGCLWGADWYMAADNPTLYYKKVECPKYLINKFYSTIDTEPPPLPDPYPIAQCAIEGSIECKQTGWYP